MERDPRGSAPFKRGVNGKLLSILVNFSNHELDNQIIRAKNAYSYLRTNDLDTRRLDPKTVRISGATS